MKYILKNICGLAAVLVLAFGSLTAQAQQYRLLTTLHVQGTTNAIAASGTTNIHVTALGTNGVTLTKYQDFTLNIDGYVAGQLTNGFLDIAWATSVDGVSWSTNLSLVAEQGGAGSQGWFRAPVSTGGSRIIWNTNVIVNSVGYWRINHITNMTGLTVSNTTIRAYVKPDRFGG